MNKIGILGSGWLGLAFAEKAKKKGHMGMVTTTTKIKVNALKNKGFHAQYLRLRINLRRNTDFFNHIDTLVIISSGLEKSKTQLCSSDRSNH